MTPRGGYFLNYLSVLAVVEAVASDIVAVVAVAVGVEVAVANV